MTDSWQHWDIATILNTYLFQALLVRKTKTHKQNQTWWRSGPGTLAGWELVCVCVSDCCLQILTRGPLLTPLSVSQVGAEACSGVSVCVCARLFMYFFSHFLSVRNVCLLLPVCQTILCVEMPFWLTVWDGHLEVCVCVCVFTSVTHSESTMPSTLGAQNYPAPEDLLC